jgi:hypothetical protein
MERQLTDAWAFAWGFRRQNNQQKQVLSVLSTAWKVVTCAVLLKI